MTKYLLTRPGGPWDYPTLGFTAVNGAILNGALSDPAISTPPDAYWAVYGGGSAETGITRTGVPSTTPSPETTDGYVLAYSDAANTFVPVDPATIGTGGGGLDDDGIAALIPDGSTATGAALATSIADAIAGAGGSGADVTNGPPVTSARTLAVIGSSIESIGDPGGGVVSRGGNSYGTLVEQMLNYRVSQVVDGGHPSQPSTTIAGFFDAEVATKTPGIVFVGAAMANDFASSLSLEQSQDVYVELLGKIRALGAIPIFATQPPRDTSGPAAAVAVRNAWIREWTASEGVTLVDFYTILADPETGGYRPELTVDGLHPSGLGYYYMAAAVSRELEPLVSRVSGVHLDTVNNAPGSILTNGMFLGAYVDGAPPDWIKVNASGGSATTVVTNVPDPFSPCGSKVRVTVTNSTGNFGGIMGYLNVNPAQGRRVRISGVVSVRGSITPTIYMDATGGTPAATSSAQFRLTSPCLDLPFKIDYAFTGQFARLYAYAGPGSGSFDLSQCRVHLLD